MLLVRRITVGIMVALQLHGLKSHRKIIKKIMILKRHLALSQKLF